MINLFKNLVWNIFFVNRLKTGIGVVLLIISIVVFYVIKNNNADIEKNLNIKNLNVTLKGEVIYSKKNEQLFIKAKFIDNQDIIFKRFVNNNIPLHIVLVSDDYNEFIHLSPKFDADTGEFFVSNPRRLEKNAYRIFFKITPKNEAEQTFVFDLLLRTHKFKPSTLITDRGKNSFNGTYRGRFYMPDVIKKNQDIEVGLRLFHKKGEVTNFQKNFGENGYLYFIDEKGNHLIQAESLSRVSLSWHIKFKQGGIYRAFAELKTKDKLEQFQYTFLVNE